MRVSISTSEAHEILPEHLSMKMVSARWTPRPLRSEQMVGRWKRRELLQPYQEYGENFSHRIFIVYGTWLPYYYPENNSKKWRRYEEGPPLTARNVPTLG